MSEQHDIPEVIKANLNYFSTLTQKTLSAFHVSGSNSTIDDEIDSIKNINKKYKKLIDVEIDDDGNYKRYFADGTSDIVPEDMVLKKHAMESNIDPVVFNALKQQMSPISTIKSSKIIEVEDKEISRPTEIIFFM
jgi:hypothetical protein